jgi:glycosyltransferase involved in cell wall biosynthesis
MDDVSIITLSKDDPAGLARTLASIPAQTLAPREVVLVRSGSSRGLALDPALAPLAVEIADPGRGISAAFNAGIGASRGAWLMFLNGGDALRGPDGLRSLDEARRAAAGADIVACRSRTDTGDRIPWRAPASFCDYLFLSHQACLFRRALFEDIGPYAEEFRVRMDLDWLARYLLARGRGRIAFADRDVVDYRMDGLSSTSLRDFYLEEFRVLARSPRLLPALAGLLLRRLPERLVRESWRRLAGDRT